MVSRHFFQWEWIFSFSTLWKFSPFEIRIQSSLSSSTKLCTTIKTISISFWHNFQLHKILHFLSERFEKSVKSWLLGLFWKVWSLVFFFNHKNFPGTFLPHFGLRYSFDSSFVNWFKAYFHGKFQAKNQFLPTFLF